VSHHTDSAATTLYAAGKAWTAALRSPDAGVLRSRIVLSPEAWARFCALAGLPTTDGAP